MAIDINNAAQTSKERAISQGQEIHLYPPVTSISSIPTIKSTLIYGFAIFAMFFGSGNLVFPLQIGLASGANWGISLLGLFITGILLPFLGLFVIKLYQGNYNEFFAEAGSLTRVLLPFFTLSLLGSFGVVPRCVTVAYGGINTIFPEISLFVFSCLFCTITFILCLKDTLMVKIMGKWMSPMLLTALITLITIGVLYAPEPTHEIGMREAFDKGFFTGYQTMDLLAAFFFSSFIFAQIKQGMPALKTDKEVAKFAIKPSLMGALLLLAIYAGFVFLGAHYSFLIEGVSPEHLLPTIAQYTMGKHATFLVSIAITLSCLTTAIALNNIYARYICSTLKIATNKFSLVLLVTTLLSFVISLLDFQGISKFLGPVLTVSYPGLIALTLLCIVTKRYKKLKIGIFYVISLCMVCKILCI